MNIRVDKINLFFPSAGSGSWKPVACVSLASCLSVLCGLSIRMPAVQNSSPWPPGPQGFHLGAIIHVCYSRCMTVSYTGLPRCIPHGWPPAWTGLNLFHSVFYRRASRAVGLPMYTPQGLRHKSASTCIQILVLGLPHCRASQLFTTWSPA